MISFPALFEQRMRSQLGQEWERFVAAHEAASPVAIRLNPAKNATITGDPIPWTQSGRYLHERPSFTLDPLFHAGTYYVQDASSMFIEQALKQSLDLTQPLRVLDLCAAPGGKSTHIASLLSEDSLLISNEVIRSRATILSENIQKWGYPNVVVTSNDPNDFNRLPGYFDAIVMDAPCSGEGLFRKDNDAMGEWSQENVSICSQRQHRILSDVWSSLKENGILVYCTCTYNEEEDEDALTWINEQKGSDTVRLTIDKQWNIEETKKGAMWGYRFFPHRLRGEGFFAGVVRKTGNESLVKIKPRTHFSSPSQRSATELTTWLREPYKYKLIMHDELVVVAPSTAVADMEFLQDKLRVVSKGTAVAISKHDKLIPEHAMALSIILDKDHFEKMELDEQQALTYLRKETLHNDENKRGFALVTHQDVPLGWVNLILGRANNLYPANWRIRK